MRRLLLLVVFFGIAISTQLPAQSTAAPVCRPVRDVKDFVAVWNDAATGPGSTSHACTQFLLTPDARITGVVVGTDGKSTRVVETPAEFVDWYRKRPEQTFWERTTHSTVEVYENVARVTRTYEVRASESGQVTATGIEDFQLIFDGSAWRAFSMLWQDASPGKPLPSRYVPGSPQP